MSIAQIIDELPKLTREELDLVAQRLADVKNGTVEVLKQPRTPGLGSARVPDLHKGLIWVADDFDEHLGDDFWLGKDA